MASWSIWTGSTFRERGDFTGIFFIIYSILLKCLDDWGLCRIANRLREEDLVVATKWSFVQSKSTNVNQWKGWEKWEILMWEQAWTMWWGATTWGRTGQIIWNYKTIWKYEIIDKSAIPANSIFFFQAGHLFTSCTWGEKPELKEERKFEEFYSKYKFRKYWPAAKLLAVFDTMVVRKCEGMANTKTKTTIKTAFQWSNARLAVIWRVEVLRRTMCVKNEKRWHGHDGASAPLPPWMQIRPLGEQTQKYKSHNRSL